MSRIACLIGKTDAGDWIDPVSGTRLTCVSDGEGINALLDKRLLIDAAKGRIGKGKTEIRLTDLVLLANNTAGGELKSRKRFVPVV